MDISERLDLLPDTIRRQILHAACGNSSGTRFTIPPDPCSSITGKKQNEESGRKRTPKATLSLLGPSLLECQLPVPEIQLVSGACIVDDFIKQDHVKEALACARQALDEVQQQAAIGGALPQVASVGRRVDTAARGDVVRWLQCAQEAAAGRGPLAALMTRMEALRRQLARQGYSVSARPTFQLACYPGGGSRYVRHADASVSCPSRTLTAIVYLNERDWAPQVDGGCLALYNVPYEGPLRGRGFAGGEPATVVAPVGGRLVVFESHLFHEVLPTYRSRYAVTAWFHQLPPTTWEQEFNAAVEPAAAPPAVPLQQQPDPPSAASGVEPDVEPLKSGPSSDGDGDRDGSGDGPPKGECSTAGNTAAAAAAASGAVVNSATATALPAAAAEDDVGTAGGGAAAAAAAAARIFVSVVAYRDPEGPWTLHSLFSQAEHPGRVRVGVVWQIDPDIEAAVGAVAGSRAHPEWLQQVRQVVLPYRDAEGPCKARALAQALWSGEEYVLQLDSHMRLVKGWDSCCIQQLAAAEAMSSTGKAVLSTYPLGYSGAGAAASVPDETSAPATLLCARGFGPDGFLRTVGRALRERPASPLRSHFWAAGLSFARAQWLREVPYCPYLPHLFFGEESYMLARMWTRGWDVFAPAVPLAFHQWERSARQHTYQRDLMGQVAMVQRYYQGGEGVQGEGHGQADGAQGQGPVEAAGLVSGALMKGSRDDGAVGRGEATLAAVGNGATAAAAASSSVTAAAATAATTVAVAARRKRSQARVLRVLSGAAAQGGDAAAAMACDAWSPPQGVGLQACEAAAAVLHCGNEDGGSDSDGRGGWAVGQVWGLGTARSLKQLAEGSGVDYTIAKVVSASAAWGGLPESMFMV